MRRNTRFMLHTIKRGAADVGVSVQTVFCNYFVFRLDIVKRQNAVAAKAYRSRKRLASALDDAQAEEIVVAPSVPMYVPHHFCCIHACAPLERSKHPRSFPCSVNGDVPISLAQACNQATGGHLDALE
jgi:hypothetical protein